MENEGKNSLQSHISRELVTHGMEAVVTALVNAFNEQASRHDHFTHDWRRFKRLARLAENMRES